jgi:hypothetical protein
LQLALSGETNLILVVLGSQLFPLSHKLVNTTITIVSHMNTLLKNEATSTMTMLPEYFQPTVKDVIIGRGRTIFLHNKAFRRLVADHLLVYSVATKVEKSCIIRIIVNQVRCNSPNGGFVKKDPKSGRWYAISDFLAKEKTSQAFRDCLFEQYKSSNTAKKLRRMHNDSLLPPRPFSALGFADHKDGQSGMDSLRSDIKGALPKLSCPSFGRVVSLDLPVAPIFNFQWDKTTTAKAKALCDLSDTPLAARSRQPSVCSVLDFALHTQLTSDEVLCSLPFNDRNEENFDAFHPFAFKSSVATAIKPQVNRNMAMMPVAAAFPPTFMQTLHQPPPADDLFERLESLAGRSLVGGDPFEPMPLMMA